MRRAARPGKSDAIALCLQCASDSTELPEETFFIKCVAAAIAGMLQRAELTIRIVDDAEGQALNQRWRGVDKPTNVLSFPVEGLRDVAPALLGDIVICAPQVVREVVAARLSAEAHWAHLTVHGVLHLLGFDHHDARDAELMEEKERVVLIGLGYPNP